jgi:hypothetical protein
VVDSEMAQSFNDLDELRRERVFVVTLACAPFARSADMVTVEALPEPGSLVEATINTADTTTGWTAFVNATAVTVTDEGDYVQATSSMPAPIGWRLWTLQLVLEFAGEAMSSTPYLRVETSGSGGSEVFTVLVDGAWVSVVPTLSQATGDVVAHFLDVDSLGSSVAGIKVTALGRPR